MNGFGAIAEHETLKPKRLTSILDRRGDAPDAREFEAESVCYLVCERIGISNPSEQYLALYLRKNEEIPAISFDRVMKAAGLIEEMGRERLGLRKK